MFSFVQLQTNQALSIILKQVLDILSQVSFQNIQEQTKAFFSIFVFTSREAAGQVEV